MNMKFVPLVSPETDNHFGYIFPVWDTLPNGQMVPSGALKFGVNHDLLGLSFDKILEERGLVNQTDSLDPMVSMCKIYLKIEGTDVIEVNLSGMQGCLFTMDHPGNYRHTTFDVTVDYVVIDVVNQKQIEHRLIFNLFGQLNLEMGTAVVHCKPIEGVELLGYTLNAKRINHNRRPIVTKSLIELQNERIVFDNVVQELTNTMQMMQRELHLAHPPLPLKTLIDDYQSQLSGIEVLIKRMKTIGR